MHLMRLNFVGRIISYNTDTFCFYIPPSIATYILKFVTVYVRLILIPRDLASPLEK